MSRKVVGEATTKNSWAQPTPESLDPIDVGAGLRRLEKLGWSPETDHHTFMMVQYALMRRARGEEAAAERAVIAQGGDTPELRAAAIDLTSWRVVLASAMAEGQRLAQTPTED